MVAPLGTLTIDATGSDGIDFETFIATYFSALTPPNGSYGFYGGVPTVTQYGPQIISGEQILYTYGSVPQRAIIGGDGEIVYDYFYYGSSFGHGFSGTIDSLTLGDWVTGITTGTPGIGDAGLVSGLDAALVISGFDITAAPGSGHTNLATSPVYAFHRYVLTGNSAAIYDIIDNYAQNVTGSSGNDSFNGSAFDDTIFGGAGDDTIGGGDGNDVLKGGAGFDFADYSTASAGVIVRLSTIQAQDTGGAGIDSLLHFEGLIGSDHNDVLIGSTRMDALYGGLGDDSLNGNQNDDLLAGGAGFDTLRGGDGNDTLIGGADRDILVGGAGEDTFVFTAVSDSAKGVDTRDTIRDFEGAGVAGGDVIDLSALNSDTVTLTFHGDGKFHGGQGDVRTYQSVGGNTFVEVDIDGDKQADMQILLSGLHNVTADDLILSGAIIG